MHPVHIELLTAVAIFVGIGAIYTIAVWRSYLRDLLAKAICLAFPLTVIVILTFC